MEQPLMSAAAALVAIIALLVGGPDSRDAEVGIAVRNAAFEISQSDRRDFTGGQPTIYARRTTVLSRDLRK